MKKLILFAITIFNFGVANASDSSKCELFINGSKAYEKEVYHRDYDVNINGSYAFRTHKKDEFYDLTFNFVTNSNTNTYLLEVYLKGEAHNFFASQKGEGLSQPISLDLNDHEGNKIKVQCVIL